jgi:hypothetical protein
MVVLSGPGGDVIAGLAIGTIIRNHGSLTYVDGGTTCESTCGYIWLAGVQRGATKTSHIGFHAAYNAATQQAIGAGNTGNTVLGSYCAGEEKVASHDHQALCQNRLSWRPGSVS